MHEPKGKECFNFFSIISEFNNKTVVAALRVKSVNWDEISQNEGNGKLQKILY